MYLLSMAASTLLANAGLLYLAATKQSMDIAIIKASLARIL